MANSKTSNSKIMVPEARAAGSIKCRMVKKMCPKRVLQYVRTDRTAERHKVSVRYIGTIMG
jgi:hypothetical protein